MAVTRKDQRANVLLSTVTQSAANTLTFNEVNVGLNLFDKIGLNIHMIQYFYNANLYADMDIDQFISQAGLVGSNQISDIGSDERPVFDKKEIYANRVGTPTSFETQFFPLISDFTGLPNGGLLLPPKPLYVAIDSTNGTTAHTLYMRLFFTIVALKDADYFELLETFRFFE